MTYTAEWKQIEYKLTFASDYADGRVQLPTVNPHVYHYGDLVDASGAELNPALPIPATSFGYYWDGWKSESGATVANASWSGLFDSGKTREATVKATCGENTYKLNFWNFTETNDASNDLLAEKALKVSQLEALPNNSTIDDNKRIYGHLLNGWKSGNETIALTTSLASASDLEVLIKKLNNGADISNSATDHTGEFDLSAIWTIAYNTAVPITDTTDGKNKATINVDVGTGEAKSIDTVKVFNASPRAVHLTAKSTVTNADLANWLFMGAPKNATGSSPDNAFAGDIKFEYDGVSFPVNGAADSNAMESIVPAGSKDTFGCVEDYLEMSFAPAIKENVLTNLAAAFATEPNSTDTYTWGKFAEIVWTVSLPDADLGNAQETTYSYKNASEIAKDQQS